MEFLKEESLEYIEFYSEVNAISNNIKNIMSYIQRIDNRDNRLYAEANLTKAIFSGISKAIGFVAELFRKIIRKITKGKIFGDPDKPVTPGGLSAAVPNNFSIAKILNKINGSEHNNQEKDIVEKISSAVKSGSDKKIEKNLSPDKMEVIIDNITTNIIKDGDSGDVGKSIKYLQDKEIVDDDGGVFKKSKVKNISELSDILDDDMIKLMDKLYLDFKSTLNQHAKRSIKLLFTNPNNISSEWVEVLNEPAHNQILYTDSFNYANRFSDDMSDIIKELYVILDVYVKDLDNIPKLNKREDKVDDIDKATKEFVKDIKNESPEFAGQKILRKFNDPNNNLDNKPIPKPVATKPGSFTGYIKDTTVENPSSVLSKGNNIDEFIKSLGDIFSINNSMANLYDKIYCSFDNTKDKTKTFLEDANKLVDKAKEINKKISDVSSSEEDADHRILDSMKIAVNAMSAIGDYILCLNLLTGHQLRTAVGLKHLYAKTTIATRIRLLLYGLLLNKDN